MDETPFSCDRDSGGHENRVARRLFGNEMNYGTKKNAARWNK